MMVVRFLLRLLLVPMGVSFAAGVATIVVCLAHWTQFLKLVASDPQAPENILIAVIFIGPFFVLTASMGSLTMLTPATLGVIISEIFAIRSILYHAANGALASWVGWITMQQTLKEYEFFKEPTILIAAGIAAGLAYWAVAGWSAGFWKPVLRSDYRSTGAPA